MSNEKWQYLAAHRQACNIAGCLPPNLYLGAPCKRVRSPGSANPSVPKVSCSACPTVRNERSENAGAVDEHVHARCACLAGTSQTSRLRRRGRRRWAQPTVLVQYTHQLLRGSLLERVIFSLYQGEVPHFRPRPQNINCARHRLPPTGVGYQPASVPQSSPVGAVWRPQGAPRRPGLGLSSLGTRGRVAGD
jgi:hypothetical protein